LRDLLSEVEEGRGQAVGIAAGPGMGKSRLVYEFRRGLGGRRLTFLEGRCLSYGSAIPYLPVLDFLRSNCGIGEVEDPAQIIDKVGFALHEVGMDAARWSPYLLHLLGIRSELYGDATLTALSPEAIKARTFEALRQMALHGSRRRPLIFVVEDLHWVDKTSEEYLAMLVENLAGAPILLLCTYRPRYLPPWIDHSYSTQIPLQRLAPPDSMSVVRSVLQTDDTSLPLMQVILDKAEGNPFFLEELARAVVEREDLGTGPTDVSSMTVPDTVQGVLMARIDRLSEEPRRALQTASVLGREFTLPLLRAIWDGEDDLEPNLLELKRLEFVYEQSGAEEPVYLFKHALTQDVAYESLLVARRKALHAAAGRALEALYAGRLEDVYDRLAYHYSKTDEAAEAVEYLTRFAEKAARAYANADAVRALEQALEHTGQLPTETQDRQALAIAFRLAHSLYFLRRIPETLELLLHHEARVTRLGDPAVAGPYYFWLGHTYSYLSDYAQANQAAERAIEEAERCGDDATKGKAYYVLARIGFGACRFREGIDYGAKAAPLLEQAQEWFWLGMSRWAVGMNLTFMGRFDQAIEAQRLTHATGEDHGDPRIQTYADWTTGWILATRGDCEAAVEACRRSLDRSRDAYNTTAALIWLGHAYMEQGDAAQAVPLLEQGGQEIQDAGHKALASWTKGWLGDAYLLGGQLDPAREAATEGLALAQSIGSGWSIAYNRRVLGRVARAEGALEEAARQYLEALHLFDEVGSSFEAARTHLDLAALAHSRGDSSAAASHVNEARGLFGVLGAPRYVAKAEQSAASLAGNPQSEPP
jgi:tetratricopeptide (TPR) repeat protein